MFFIQHFKTRALFQVAPSYIGNAKLDPRSSLCLSVIIDVIFNNPNRRTLSIPVSLNSNRAEACNNPQYSNMLETLVFRTLLTKLGLPFMRRRRNHDHLDLRTLRITIKAIVKGCCKQICHKYESNCEVGLINLVCCGKNTRIFEYLLLRRTLLRHVLVVRRHRERERERANARGVHIS